ncbi:LPS-assembly protein LptD [Limnohabitans sp. 103DPR2]|uniref:LPS-assembly protein LptD n=1 Tax=Limnohabitans sp. 103DPR2 TaxID=1678129 RepID=UPI0007069B46|nr:LPS assembly protein LptD [Limnohabitans sp. 103DPR2]ALK90663.1 LPS-assembly protein LptD precursor [Limnohabitans sp. 103DPR2]
MKTTHTFQKQKLAQALTLCGVLLWQLPSVAQEKGPAASAPPAKASASVVLQSSLRLEEKISDLERKQSPVFVSGQRIDARPDLDLVIEGDAILRKQGLSVRAQRIEYDQSQDTLKAQGQVRIMREGNVFEGPLLQLQADSFQGKFLQPTYSLLKGGGHGDAAEIEFIDAQRATVRNATYTTCSRVPGPSWLPEWVLKAASLQVNEEDNTVQAKDMQLRFKDVPILAAPSLTFPLNSARQSGLLAPLIGIDTVSGIEVSSPYYWNIAPNRDATLSTTVMSKRGVALDSEFRYLETDSQGQARLNVMPNDSLRQQSRWGLSAQHIGGIETGNSVLGRLGVNVNLNRVSDDNYWRDFPRAGLSLTQRLLPASGSLYWGQGDWTLMTQVLKFQTLQDISSPITPPYDRSPQMVARYNKWDVQGFDVGFTADTTRFEADYSQIPGGTSAILRNGQRSYAAAQISHPWLKPWGFVIPKIQLHGTRYQLDTPLATGQSEVNRLLPTFSLDTGLVYERDASFFGRGLRQTLEPRAFFVRTPYKDQSQLPSYDSGATDFNLTTVYSENPYVGQDRIADNNLVTLGVNSRLFDNNTGAELARFGVAQRYRFSDQLVRLPGELPVSSGFSDILLGAGVRWDNRWTFDSTLQFDAQTHRTTRTTLTTRFNPSPYRVFNTAYRLTRDQSEQIDLGWQWPLRDFAWGTDEAPAAGQALAPGQGLGADRWYSVGRMNFSLKDRKMVDTLLGFEYDAGCWLGRVVYERLQSTTSTSRSRILFQLEFVGLARVGSSPLKTLRDNIPRYQYLREDLAPTSRFTSYD